MKKSTIAICLLLVVCLWGLNASEKGSYTPFNYSVSTSLTTCTPLRLIRDFEYEIVKMESPNDYFEQLGFTFNASFLCNYTPWIATGIELRTNYFLLPFIEGSFFTKVNCAKNLYVKLGIGFYSLLFPEFAPKLDTTIPEAEAKLGLEKLGGGSSNFYYFMEIGPVFFFEKDITYDIYKLKGYLGVTFGTGVTF